jgi:hypothetical protein
MKSIFVELPETHMRFHLFDYEVDARMAKKLRNLGLADIEIQYPMNASDKFFHEGNGIYRQGNFACGSIRISAATQDADFRTVFDPSNNTVDVKLKGRFFCCHIVEDKNGLSVDQQTFGFVSGIRLTDSKGKHVKKPKDQWGMSIPIEALVEKEIYNNAALRVNLKVFIEDYYDF